MPDKKHPDAKATLTNAEIGELLVKAAGLAAWFEDLQAYALKTLLDGGEIPGWKAVAGKSNRAFSNADEAISAVISAGYDEAVVYERKAKSLAELEKLMGKADFNKVCGKYVVKPLV